ncbi:MAG: aldose 1-epimerase family protein [Chloroflexota bacterium]
MELWGRNYTRRELEGFTGDLRQIADIRLVTLDDGMERGVRVAEVRTGSGFDFTVLLDRAMDIGTATFNGVPIAWQSGTGAANPSRYEPSSKGWLRTFHGGLLALCGLSQAGAANTDPETGEELGLHGRIGTVPAQDIRIERVWLKDDQWVMRLSGTVDEVSLFGWRLRLERIMEFTPGQPAVLIHDRVRNMGGLPAPLMVLYHCNFGWPLVSPDSEIISPSKNIKPRDAVAEPGIGQWHKLQKPTPGYAEQVFFHYTEPSEQLLSASIVNKALELGLSVLFDSRTLPYLTEWKQMGYSDYVVGLEPGNCLPMGRTEARTAKQLRMLPPGETDTFTIGFQVFKP